MPTPPRLVIVPPITARYTCFDKGTVYSPMKFSSTFSGYPSYGAQKAAITLWLQTMNDMCKFGNKSTWSQRN